MTIPANNSGVGFPWSLPVLLVAATVLLSGHACSSSNPATTPGASRGRGQVTVDLEALGKAMLPVTVTSVAWDGSTGIPVVLVRYPPTGVLVPIWVGPAEGQAIASALTGSAPPRPMTHDLMGYLLDGLGGRLEEVWIHGMADSTFLGLLKVVRSGSDAPILLDTRPSDGIALALRVGAPVRMHREIIAAAGVDESELRAGAERTARGLGMTVGVLGEEDAAARGLSPREGVMVRRVEAEAEAAGVLAGDVVLRLAGRSITGIESFIGALMSLRRVEEVEVVVWRAGEEVGLIVVPEPLDLNPRRRDPPLPVA